MKTKETNKREKIVTGLRSLGAVRIKVSHASLIRSSILFIVLLIAFIVRILPIRWGYSLNEFDPYLQYRLTKHLAENGLLSWSPWQDYMSWYPWGRNMPRTAYPGLAFTAAALYMVLKALGVPMVPGPTLDPLQSDPVYNLSVIFPVIMGTVTCLVIYFLGKELAGDVVGLFAAFFLALDSSYIGRTTLGFFDDETVGIFTILLFILFFTRSLDVNRSLNSFLFYSSGSGLLLGYLSISWGASRFLMAMTALFALTLIVTRRYSSRLLMSYGITFILGLAIAVSIPYLSVSFLFDTSILPVYGVFFLLCLLEINRRARTLERKVAYFIGFVALISVLFALLWHMGFIKALEAKFWSLINPWLRPSYPLI
ncbi:MAG: STT3 domain-containing protein, partial [Nitrososphaerota archaeon]